MKSLPVPRRVLFTASAFLVAPLVAALGLSLGGAVLNGSPELKVSEVLVWAFIFYFYAVWPTVLFGIPSFLVLRKLGGIRWWSTALVGFGVGVLVLAIIDPRGLSVVANQGTLLWGGVGSVSALTFWLIWKQGQDSSHRST